MPLLKFILVPMGSAGDVLPLVWLGRMLRKRGHEVVVIAQGQGRDMPERAGLRTVAWGTVAEQEKVIRDPDLWHPRKAVNVVMEFAGKWACENIAAIRPELESGRTVMIAGALAFGARVIAERWGVPLLTVHLQPAVFMSVQESPVMMAGMEWLPKAPRWFRKFFFGMANRQVDRQMSPAVEEVRRSVGLPVEKEHRIKGIMRSYWHSPDGVLCLFPEWFAGKAADWPKQAVLTRFPLYDEDDSRPLEPALEKFLSHHAEKNVRPVVITPGSANAHAEIFLREAAQACRAIGRPAVIVTRFPEQAPATQNQPAGDLFVASYAPFSLLFPQATAVMHHGGIGTMSQCFSAGVPQLIMPLAHDQPDNAARIKRLGAGDYLYPRAFREAKIAPVLQRLIVSEEVRQSCANLRQKCREQMTEEKMAELIETLSERAFRAGGKNGMNVASALESSAAEIGH